MARVSTAEQGRARAVLVTAIALIVVVVAAWPSPAAARLKGCDFSDSGCSLGDAPAEVTEEPVAEEVVEAVIEPPAAATPPAPTTTTTAAPRRRVLRQAVVTTSTTSTTVVAEVLGFTATTEPKVRRKAAPPPPPPESRRTAFVASIPRPKEVSWSAGHVAGNASLALLLVLLLGLPAEVLNSSIRARLEGRKQRTRWKPLARVEARVNQLPDPLLLVGFGVASAIVYSQLDSSIGFDGTSMLFIGALAFALIIVTGVLEAIRIPYLNKRHQVRSHLQMFPKAFVMAVILVLLSRITGFHPGFIFGVTCGLAVSGRLADEDEGRSIAVACSGLLIVSAIAWLTWIPAASAASADHPSTWAILADTFLATLWVTGLQVVLFGLLPVRFLYGEKVIQWSRTGWLTLYGAAMFMFIQTLFHPSAGQWGGFSTGTMWVIAGLIVVAQLASFAVWFWVRVRPPEAEPALDLVV